MIVYKLLAIDNRGYMLSWLSKYYLGDATRYYEQNTDYDFETPSLAFATKQDLKEFMRNECVESRDRGWSMWEIEAESATPVQTLMQGFRLIERTDDVIRAIKEFWDSDEPFKSDCEKPRRAAAPYGTVAIYKFRLNRPIEVDDGL